MKKPPVWTPLCSALAVISTVLVFYVKRESADPEFRHQISGGTFPWKHTNFDDGNDKFTFAMFGDLTGGERERVFDVAMAQLNLLRPELIINVGDLIEGDATESGELHKQWNTFDERAARAKAPVFYAGGNHDLTGEVLRDVWEERLGPRYYYFVYKDVLFLVLDTEDNTVERMREIEKARVTAVEIYKTDGPAAFAETEYARMPERTSGTVGPEQASYFVEAIEANPDVKWTFLFLHKAAWQRQEEENFAAIESAMSNRPYTVFYGHTHVFQYQKRKGRDYINLATSGGEQFPEKGRSMDHLFFVTVDKESVTIANLLMEGILDKTGRIPLGGDSLEFEKSKP